MDKYALLSWNVRGLNMRARRDVVRVLVGDARPAIVCLQETKLAVIQPNVVFSTLGAQFGDFDYLPASETRGGVLVAGRNDVVSLSDEYVGCYSVTVKVTHLADDTSRWLTTVYGPQEDAEKILFLEELQAIWNVHHGPWAVTGDFNLILSSADKINDRINRRNMARFRRAVDELELKDMHLHGRRYTWSNERTNPTLVKLDRVLVTADWEDLFPFCYLQAPSSEASDHCPLLMQSNAAIRSKPRFHFEIFWLKLEGYQETVARGWTCPPEVTDPFRRLDNLIRSVCKELQSWADKTVGNVKLQLLLAKEVILRFDQAQECRQLSADELDLRRQLKGLCLGLASLERMIARQRSRITFLWEGDANTRFFHMHATYRRRKNHIRSLEADHFTASSPEDLADVLYEYYDGLLGRELGRESTINFEAIGIEPADLTELELPFTKEEVWGVIRELPADKAPGPDGLTGVFYKSAWAIIRQDMVTALNAFYAVDRRQFRCLNTALLTLIPKKPDASRPQDYRPISLIHSFPKLVSKLLANRLAPRLKDLVLRNQSAFIKGRSILDNFKYV